MRHLPHGKEPEMRLGRLKIGCLLPLVAGFVLAFAPGPVPAKGALKIGYFDIPPHVTGAESGKPQGAAISYFEEFIAPRFGVPFEWNAEVTAPTRLMNQLGSGEIDAMIFLGRTKDREAIFRYPDPYLVIPEALAFRQEHPIDRITDVSDLHGLVLGFLVGGRIPDQLRDDTIKFDLIAGKRLMERNLEKLMLGRIDAIYAPLSTAVVNIIDDMGLRDQIKLVPIDFLGPVEIYTVFSKETVSETVVEKYNIALSGAMSERTYVDHIEIFKSGETAD
jgi:ABC-type amino acid transport substrate-binding protein